MENILNVKYFKNDYKKRGHQFGDLFTNGGTNPCSFAVLPARLTGGSHIITDSFCKLDKRFNVVAVPLIADNHFFTSNNQNVLIIDKEAFLFVTGDSAGLCKMADHTPILLQFIRKNSFCIEFCL